MRNKLAFALATAGGAGYFPKGPGTAGSLVGVAAVYLGVPPLLGAALLLLPAVWSAQAVARHLSSKDPQIVVIDEVLGQWITFVGASTAPLSLAVGFVLFRLFDITKPWPARRLEKLPGGWGIVLDDVMAGVYGCFAMLLLRWLHLVS